MKYPLMNLNWNKREMEGMGGGGGGKDIVDDFITWSRDVDIKNLVHEERIVILFSIWRGIERHTLIYSYRYG